jgi:ribosomal protein L37AE/L43A
MKLKIYCVHTEPELQRNIECQLIENDMAYVYACPQCHREIVFDLALEENELP